MDTQRQSMQFREAVASSFMFLHELGFHVVEATDSISRHRHGDILVNVFHGRQSYEIGFEIGDGNEMFSMSELIRAADPVAGARYRNPVATTAADVFNQLQRLASLVQVYADRALRGDSSVFTDLRRQRKTWSEDYALDVLSSQVRPKAEEAFREGRYREAADLYGQIKARLNAAEIKKLEIAGRRSQRGDDK
jgi:hypothetical protein